MFTRAVISKINIIQSPRLSQKWSLGSLKAPSNVINKYYCSPGGIPGSGAGKGGGAGGSVKEAGGGLGRFAVAQEEGYFYNQEREKLSKLKKQLKDNAKLHQKDKKPK